MPKIKTITPGAYADKAERLLQANDVIESNKRAILAIITRTTRVKSEVELENIFDYFRDLAFERCHTFEGRMNHEHKKAASMKTWLLGTVLPHAIMNHARLRSTQVRALETRSIDQATGHLMMNIARSANSDAETINGDYMSFMESDELAVDEQACRSEFLQTIGAEFVEACRATLTAAELALLVETNGLERLGGMCEAEKRDLAAKVGATYDFVRRCVSSLQPRVLAVMKEFKAAGRIVDSEEGLLALDAFNLSFSK